MEESESTTSTTSTAGSNGLASISQGLTQMLSSVSGAPISMMPPEETSTNGTTSESAVTTDFSVFPRAKGRTTTQHPGVAFVAFDFESGGQDFRKHSLFEVGLAAFLLYVNPQAERREDRLSLCMLGKKNFVVRQPFGVLRLEPRCASEHFLREGNEEMFRTIVRQAGDSGAEEMLNKDECNGAMREWMRPHRETAARCGFAEGFFWLTDCPGYDPIWMDHLVKEGLGLDEENASLLYAVLQPGTYRPVRDLMSYAQGVYGWAPQHGIWARKLEDLVKELKLPVPPHVRMTHRGCDDAEFIGFCYAALVAYSMEKEEALHGAPIAPPTLSLVSNGKEKKEEEIARVEIRPGVLANLTGYDVVVRMETTNAKPPLDLLIPADPQGAMAYVNYETCGDENGQLSFHAEEGSPPHRMLHVATATKRDKTGLVVVGLCDATTRILVTPHVALALEANPQGRIGEVYTADTSPGSAIYEETYDTKRGVLSKRRLVAVRRLVEWPLCSESGRPKKKGKK